MLLFSDLLGDDRLFFLFLELDLLRFLLKVVLPLLLQESLSLLLGEVEVFFPVLMRLSLLDPDARTDSLHDFGLMHRGYLLKVEPSRVLNRVVGVA